MGGNIIDRVRTTFALNENKVIDGIYEIGEDKKKEIARRSIMLTSGSVVG
jgi:hypothetical protein